MPVISYTAVDRGRLASGHSAGVEYQIETALESFPRTFQPRRSMDETLDGRPESWMDALLEEWQVAVDLVFPEDIDVWREFVTSVANTETFSIDFTGTIASPGTSIEGWMTDRRILEGQESSVGFRYSFGFRALP